MEKLPGEVTRLSPGNFSPPTFQTGRFPGETDVSPVKLPGEEFGLKGVLEGNSLFIACKLVHDQHSERELEQVYSGLDEVQHYYGMKHNTGSMNMQWSRGNKSDNCSSMNSLTIAVSTREHATN